MLTFILYQCVGPMFLASDSLPIFQDTGIYPGECINMSRVQVLFAWFFHSGITNWPANLKC